MSDTTTGGRLLADQLAAAGVETIFSLAGAGHTHLLLALEELGVRIVGTRHETGAVGAADGYARATGGIGVAAIIAEQGLPNAVTPLQTAFLYGSAVLVLVTRFPQSWLEAAGEVPVDHHALLAPITKWVRTVPSADRLGEYLEAGLRIAQAGRPGPVVLVMPQDFLAAPVPQASRRPPPVRPIPAAASREGIARLHQLLAAAERPALLADAGLDGPRAGTALRALNARGMPVFGYGGGRGALAEDDQDGVLPWPFAQFALPACDLLVVAGARLNLWFGFGRPPRFADGMTVAQIDDTPEAIGRNRAVALGIVADPATALGQIASVADDHGLNWRREWLDEALAPRRQAIAEARSDRIHPLALVSALQAHRDDRGFLVADGADILNWSHAAFRVRRPRGYMDHHPMGSMGIGLPLAIGAAAAERDLARREGRAPTDVLLLTGDGAIGFYLAELDTVARERLPLKIAIGNDAQWGTEYHGQTLVTGRSINTRLAVRDYAQVARGLGMTAASVAAPADLPAAVAELSASEGPALLDVHIDREAGAALKRDPRLSFLIFSDLAPPAR